MTVTGWALAVYFASTTIWAIVEGGSRWTWDELVGLATWPVMVPVGYALSWWRRHQRRQTPTGEDGGPDA